MDVPVTSNDHKNVFNSLSTYQMCVLSQNDFSVNAINLPHDVNNQLSEDLKSRFVSGFIPSQLININSSSAISSTTPDMLYASQKFFAMPALIPVDQIQNSFSFEEQKTGNSVVTQVDSPSSTVTSPTSTILSPDFKLSKDPQFHRMLSDQSNQSSSSSKHICAICGDRASGKHYSVFSCEGCKGFFKRTVRKELTYACREDKNCIIDKRQRNRCQYCRYMKCLNQGMKREAVQDERQKNKDRDDDDNEGASASNEMPVEKLLEAEFAVDPGVDTYVDTQNDPVDDLCHAADKQLFTLVQWAKRVPNFDTLPLDDQVLLLRAGWNELLVAAISHRSIVVRDGLLLSTGVHVNRSTAYQNGVGPLFDRVMTELVGKMRDLRMDRVELACIRAIILFNPDVKGLQVPMQVETLRERVYASLEDYCKIHYSGEPGRFARLLLRLPALRSIGLKCLEHLFFMKLVGKQPVDTILLQMLELPNLVP